MHEHAEHFLRRLDRLAGPEVELALGLYRDPGLLRSVLGALPLPESAERVAISLDDAARGPFLIVTRDGHFVTCLGRGMKPGEHPVVSRGQLDALSAKVDSLRERLALATRVDSNRERACAKLLSRLFIGSDRVSREDFLAVSAWEPMLAPAFVEMFPRMTHALVEQAVVLRSLRTKNRNIERAMHEYWKPEAAEQAGSPNRCAESTRPSTKIEYPRLIAGGDLLRYLLLMSPNESDKMLSERAREKRQAREEDERALRSGEKSSEQLRAENHLFASRRVRLLVDPKAAL